MNTNIVYRNFGGTNFALKFFASNYDLENMQPP